MSSYAILPTHTLAESLYKTPEARWQTKSSALNASVRTLNRTVYCIAIPVIAALAILAITGMIYFSIQADKAHTRGSLGAALSGGGGGLLTIASFFGAYVTHDLNSKRISEELLTVNGVLELRGACRQA